VKVELAPRTSDPANTTRRNEVLLVLGVSLGSSAVYAFVRIIARLTAPEPLSQQTATLNRSRADQPYLDLTLQLLAIFFALVPVLLAIHLLNRERDARATLGLDGRRPWFDAKWGAKLALLIGVPGIGLYVGARELGLNTTVAAADLPHLWWAVPVLILAAAQNAILEEVVVVGYLMTRLEEMGWRIRNVIVASALLRGSYHLYQGFGGFVGNAVMGVIFAYFYLRTRRVLPLVIAHTLLDVFAFVGYTLLKDRVTWL
jgi:membrane protease YdiL (CAAX protease family)